MRENIENEYKTHLLSLFFVKELENAITSMMFETDEYVADKSYPPKTLNWSKKWGPHKA